MTKTKRITAAIAMLLVSATLLATASYAWFAMNTQTSADGFEVEAYTDSLYLEISQDDDTGYGVETTFADAKQDLRLVTASLFKNYNFRTLTASSASGIYEGTGNYYRPITSANGGTNYIYANADLVPASSVDGYYMNPEFEVVNTHEVVTGTYYVYDKANNTYTAVEITDADAYGKLNLKSGTATGTYTAANATAEDVFYKNDGNGNLVQATDLKAASPLDGYVTLSNINTIQVTDEAVADTSYYIVSENGDYSYIGTAKETPSAVGEFAKGTLLGEYLFWGSAYSTEFDEAQPDKTLNMLGDNVYSEYVLTKTLYLRCATGTNNASNLKVDEIVVSGAKNALSDALRVLIVATSSADVNSPKRISSCLYDAGTDKYYYSNDDGTGNGNLFDTVLGNEKELITVQVYIYFDGTDEVSTNSTVAQGTLNAQSIEIKFGINELDYNPQNPAAPSAGNKPTQP